MFSIRNDHWSNKRVKVDLNDFEAGVDYILNNHCDGIDLRGPIGSDKIIADFSVLKKIAHQITYMSIGSDVELQRHKNTDALYDVIALQKLILEKQTIDLDFSKLPNLIYLGIEHSENCRNISSLKKLETLVLRKYKGKDLSVLTGLNALKTLHVYQSSIENLVGIADFHHLEALTLSFNKKLNSPAIINALPQLKKLHIEKCPLVTKVDFLKQNKTIEDLFISELESLHFTCNMPSLKKINFWNVEDGDLTPLLKTPGLMDVSFHPNRKNYSHTKDQILNALRKQTPHLL